MVFGLPDGRKDSVKAATSARKKDPSLQLKIFRYANLPGIFPRIRAIGEKFGHFAYMLAMVFRSTRLLPEGHPMLNPANIGRFGITDVIATAANGLVMKRDNMDQILIFGAVIMAMLMIVVQVLMIGAYAFLGSAHAADTSSMFTTPNPGTDLMTQFLSQVFGFKTIFANSAAVDQPGLYAILGFYSTAMMIIAVMIVVYYVITVVGESAQTGQPFGKRFNGLWAPIRLVLALGLLVPLGGGINAAQYLTLYVAKFGSGLATQGWVTFSKSFTKPSSVVSSMSAPSAQGLASAVFAAEACRGAYNQAHTGSPNPVVIRVNAGEKSQVAAFGQGDIDFAKAQHASNLTYVWTTQGSDSDAAASAICGAINMKVAATPSTGVTPDANMSAADTITSAMQNSYVTAIGTMIGTISGGTNAVAPSSPIAKFVGQTMTMNETSSFMTNTDPAVRTDVIKSVAGAIDAMQNSMNSAMDSVNNSLAGNNPSLDQIQTKMQTDATNKGWATAGVYYLEMAKYTQMVMDAVSGAVPAAISQPSGSSGTASDWWSWFKGQVGGDDVNKQIKTVIDNVKPTIAAAIGQATAQPTSKNPNESFLNHSCSLLDPIKCLATWLFGDSFFLLLDTPNLNPMGRLIAGGQSILDRTSGLVFWYIMSQMGSLAAGAVGAVAGFVGGAGATIETGPGALVGGGVGAAAVGIGAAIVAQIASMLGGVLWFFMLIGLGAGIVLFYLLPLLPFMYFFFSAVNWVIEVAEAFISMPLFALSHLRIDGDGLLPSRAFENWLILFGILLRPLMIIVGMIVGSLVFNAGAFYLGSIYKYAIFAYNNDQSNAAGGVSLTATGLDFSKVSGFGIVTYLVLYVYLIYMLATSSFKLIDQIPDKMLRWVGGTTPFTGDRPVDLQGMHGSALMAYGVVQQGSTAVKGLGDGLGGAMQKLGSSRKPPTSGGKGPEVG